MSITTTDPPADLSDTESPSHEAAKKERRRGQNRRNQRAWRKQPTGLTFPGFDARSTISRRTTPCRTAHQSYRGNPQADHLLTVAKLNVFRAFVRNITVLGYTREWMTDDALSRFSIHGPHPTNPVGTSLPSSLRPTEMQRSELHHPWLDFFPFARLRDNLIRYQDCMDESRFCQDLMGFWTMPTEENCVLVWGNPWDPMNWEITEAFLRKWGGLVKGCPEILWSTNYWRRLRGEKRLVWRASFDTVQ
ncbi:DUF3425 domain-containing protein [Aspergillus ibericus CBS 121593]|uniref:Uncharacterized protein n=1 Tax=Aspergillus ibericus CBS 121593 TaxID=1448316 RepID=A0A395H713_9EURO|nr:hypothetical protein BO80DRAFT_491482 [Aspergillus ibericus CBS 121593]RAL03712.1 hypothetical protein BO80DRAFT_491482 [Aspergillus ibericus CBS 121593]